MKRHPLIRLLIPPIVHIHVRYLPLCIRLMTLLLFTMWSLFVRLIISFLCLKMHAYRWRIFPNKQWEARFRYRLVLGPLFQECHHLMPLISSNYLILSLHKILDEIQVNQLLGLYNNNDCKGMESLFQQNKVPHPQTVASRACMAINRGFKTLSRVGYLDTPKPIKFRKNLNHLHQNKEESELGMWN